MSTTVPEWGQPVDPFRPYLRLRRGKVWYIKRKAGNVRLSTDLDEAKILYDAELGKTVSDNRTIRCRQAWDTYIDEHPLAPTTRKRYQGIWSKWASPLLAGMRVSEVQPRDIIRVLDRMRAHGVSSDNGYRALSSFFRSCTKEPTRYRADTPVASIGKKYIPSSETGQVDEEVVVLSDETIEAMAGIAEVIGNPERLDERMNAVQTATIIRLQSQVGARIAELLGLYVSDIKDDRLHIERQVAADFQASLPDSWFRNLKGRKGTIGNARRVVRLSPKAKQVLYAYVEQGVLEGWLKMNGLLFPNAAGRPRASGHVITKITEVHRLASTGVSGTHCFRHTAASRWLMNGATLEEVANLLGNTPEVVRTRYGHLVELEKLDERYAEFMDD